MQRAKKRLKIGVHGQITSEEARTLAKQYLGKVIHGEDPAAKKKENRDIPTVKALAEDYLERHAFRKRPRSIQEDQKLFRQIILPSLGKRCVKDITRRDIELIHLQLQKTPYHANRVLALLSKMFSLAVIWGWRADNPVKGMERYQEEKRDRWLDKKELNRFWEILERYPNHNAAVALKILLLTGARKNEVLQATWDQFDMQQGVWTKPSHLTKQKKKEHLPLSEQALEILRDLKEHSKNDSPCLFSNPLTGQPFRDVRAFWAKVLKEDNLQDVRIHDLRHTHASHLVSSDLSLSIVGKLLGHTQASTTHRYAHLADDPLRQAAELFSAKVKTVITKKIVT